MYEWSPTLFVIGADETLITIFSFFLAEKNAFIAIAFLISYGSQSLVFLTLILSQLVVKVGAEGLGST
jgi:hypothetical protein